jgi:hypothetical protein
MTVARELARYKLDLLSVQEFRWNKGGTVRAGDYTVKPLSIIFQGTGKFERYTREMIVPGNH